MFCSKCGKEMANNLIVCPYCGEPAVGEDRGAGIASNGNINLETVLGNTGLINKAPEKKQWGKILLLSILTGGVYSTYYWYQQFRDINTMDSKGESNRVIPYFLYLLLNLCTGSIAGFIIMIMYYKRALVLADKYSIILKPKSPVLYALLMYIPIFSFYVEVKNHNKLIDAYKSNTKSATGYAGVR